jgi:hypothetical protein
VRIVESGRTPWARWLTITAKQRTLRLYPQADWLFPAEVALQQAVQENRIDDAAITGAKSLLARVAPHAPYLAIIGVLEQGSSVHLQLMLIDPRGRVLRVPKITVDDSFLGLEAELDGLFETMRGGKLRWSGLNKGPIFPGLEEKPGEAPEVVFKALAEVKGGIDSIGKDEEKDQDLEEDDDAPEEKDRMRPVIRREGRSNSRSAATIERRQGSFRDFKDDDDK